MATGGSGGAFKPEEGVQATRRPIWKAAGTMRRRNAKKKARFDLRFVHGLHGQAWKECEELVLSPEKLKEPEEYKYIFAASAGDRASRGDQPRRGL